MKVVYITLSTILTGGGSRAFLNMLYACMARGVEPLVVCPDRGDLYRKLSSEGIRTIAVPYSQSTYPAIGSFRDAILFLPRLCKRLLLNPLAVIRIAKQVRNFHPDLIHTNVSLTSVGYHVARRLRVPHVWHLREYSELIGDRWLPSYSSQMRKYHAAQSYTICITRGMQQHYQLAGYQSSRVIYDAITPVLPPYNQGNKTYFLFVGRVEHNKGVLPMLEAYALYTRQTSCPLPLYIVGHYNNDAYFRQCQQTISRHHLQDLVHFHGKTHDVSAYYREATALIIPSLVEGFGLVVAEAMSAGCIVIGHDTTGIKEQFDNGLALTGEPIGLCYATPDQLAAHLLSVSDAPASAYIPMLQRARQTVTHLYSKQACADGIMVFYRHIIGNATIV